MFKNLFNIQQKHQNQNEKSNSLQTLSNLVNQRRPFVQLDDPFAVLVSISGFTKLYK